jgi:hypothetical protein
MPIYMAVASTGMAQIVQERIKKIRNSSVDFPYFRLAHATLFVVFAVIDD